MDEETTGRLLRIGGMRADVPMDREGRVKRAFLDECSAVAHARVVRRRIVTVAAVFSLAAGVIVGVRVWWPREVMPTVQPIVATVERLEGGGGRLNVPGDSTAGTPIGPADTLRAGARIETDANGRIGLRLSHGVSLRLDHGSRARLASASAIELGAGAVYVDSGSPASTGALEVHTSFGVVRDIGTQFEVRLTDSSLRVRVRSGVVEVRRGSRADQGVSARPGTELTFGPTGVSSRPLVAYGPEWTWAASLAPAFQIEGRTLGAFLEHLCWEQGWTLAYADPKLRLEASGIILHGPTMGVASEALAVVLATTGLTHRLEDGNLVVARARQ